MGYAYRVTWGGSSIFTSRAANSGVPAVKLQLTRDRWYAFVGMKTGLLLNDLILEQETQYGFLAGAGVDVAMVAGGAGREVAVGGLAVEDVAVEGVVVAGVVVEGVVVAGVVGVVLGAVVGTAVASSAGHPNRDAKAVARSPPA